MLANRFEIGNVEIGADEIAAIRKVVAVARDSRQPAPDMRAVSPDDPEPDDSLSAWFVDIAVGASYAIGASDPFPIMTKLMTRFGAGQHRPKYVRVDTSDTYPAFCAECSPEMAELRGLILDLADKLEAHVHDPDAHQDLSEAIEHVEAVGADLAEAEKAKEIDLQLPPHLAPMKKFVRAWREGDVVCASLTLPGCDGDVRICTSMMPVVRAVEEMERYAAAANVSAPAIVGHIPWMGCALGAATLLKEMVAAAPSILQRPEAASRSSFMCRIEPKANPALCAFDILARMCRSGDPQAKAEWNALAEAAGRGAPQVAQAMREVGGLLESPPVAFVGGEPMYVIDRPTTVRINTTNPDGSGGTYPYHNPKKVVIYGGALMGSPSGQTISRWVFASPRSVQVDDLGMPSGAYDDVIVEGGTMQGVSPLMPQRQLPLPRSGRAQRARGADGDGQGLPSDSSVRRGARHFRW